MHFFCPGREGKRLCQLIQPRGAMLLLLPSREQGQAGEQPGCCRPGASWDGSVTTAALFEGFFVCFGVF